MDLLGKKARELQTGVKVSWNKITGTLKKVSGYTGFNGTVVDEQSGHYLALEFDCLPEADTITVELMGGTKGPVKLDEDRMIVLRITDKTKNTIKVTATKDEQNAVEEYDISGLTLALE